MKNDLGDLEFFGENLYAVHSIAYTQLEHYYFVFAARINEVWLSWEEVTFYANLFDLPMVPVLRSDSVRDLTETQLEKTVQHLASQPSIFGSVDPGTGISCTSEGLVCRNAGLIPPPNFSIISLSMCAKDMYRRMNIGLKPGKERNLFGKGKKLMEWKLTTDKDWLKLEKQFSWVEAMRNVPQDPIHHAEGNVAIHTQLVLEQLQQSNIYRRLGRQRQELLWAAALLHDVEKGLRP
ncbi:hypothetical protein KUH03_04940 [Sphingobacterium sp. E70]|uniref:RNA ligase family protein n=1 Tax=Sphingobacterium sp. E70 TaxID=2853439 RepID=UPI00211CB8A6|nr:RNA ligase family protein [Sphingobacterium sp. E70]ULT26265.1 hypothetical protein KUH03_04940 [Sphingobacterium sp. E70]